MQYVGQRDIKRHKIDKISLFCFRKVFFGLCFEKQAIVFVITTLEFLHLCCIGNIPSSASPSFRTEFLDFFWPQGLISTVKFMYRYHFVKTSKEWSATQRRKEWRRNRRSVSALSAGAYTTLCSWWKDYRVKGRGCASPTLTRLGWIYHRDWM